MKRSTIAIIILGIIYILLPGASLLIAFHVWGHKIEVLKLSQPDTYQLGVSPETISMEGSDIDNQWTRRVGLIVKCDSSAQNSSISYAPELNTLVKTVTRPGTLDIMLDYDAIEKTYSDVRIESDVRITVILPRPAKQINAPAAGSLTITGMAADSLNINNLTRGLEIDKSRIGFISLHTLDHGWIKLSNHTSVGCLDWHSASKDVNQSSLIVSETSELNGLKWRSDNPKGFLESTFHGATTLKNIN